LGGCLRSFTICSGVEGRGGGKPRASCTMLVGLTVVISGRLATEEGVRGMERGDGEDTGVLLGTIEDAWELLPPVGVGLLWGVFPRPSSRWELVIGAQGLILYYAGLQSSQPFTSSSRVAWGKSVAENRASSGLGIGVCLFCDMVGSQCNLTIAGQLQGNRGQWGMWVCRPRSEGLCQLDRTACKRRAQRVYKGEFVVLILVLVCY
jgi:hypothetical protein